MDAYTVDSVYSRKLDGSADIVAVAYDFSNLFLATVTSDGKAVHWHRSDKQSPWTLSAQWSIQSCEPPVTVEWAHPSFGLLQVVGSRSGYVDILDGQQELLRQAGNPESTAKSVRQPLARIKCGSPVNDLAFAPPECGLQVAVATAKGISFHVPCTSLNTWKLENDLQVGNSEECTAIAWQPHRQKLPPMLLAGTTQGAKICWYQAELMRWQVTAALPVEGTVTSVSWAPLPGPPNELVAVASQTFVHIISLSGAADNLQVAVAAHLQHPAPVLKTAWNMFNTAIAVSTDNSEVNLWRCTKEGSWIQSNCIQGEPDYIDGGKS